MGNEAYDVFVSYSRMDWRHAVEIDSALRARGLKPFFDRRNLRPGLPWVRALEEAIAACKAALVLIGPRGFGNTQQYERDLAFFRQTRDPAFPVVPVILPEAGLDRPFNFLQILTWIDFSHVAKVSDAPEELGRLLTAVQGGQASADTTREAICPYRGLDAFREEDSAFFFGRGTADDPASPIGQLVGKVREHPFVVVVGRSGSGKSSLIYAGLMPALRRERDRFWNILTLRPGAEPFEALATAFNPPADGEGKVAYAAKIIAEADKLRTGDPKLLSLMIRRELDQAEGRPDRLLLYIDQWEELYAQAPSPSIDKERAAQHAADVSRFIDSLLAASQSSQVSVVATVRADFYDPLIGHPTIRELLPTQQVLLGSMSRSELERTIVEPAKKVGLAFDPRSLVKQILDEAGEDEGTLPLLQYALKETFEFREGNVMTANSYARSGGVREAIRNTAERTFDALSREGQQAARKLFLRLVTPGEGQEDTRASAVMPTDETLRKIVEQFAGPRTRLLVTGRDRAARPTVEVAHEALIRTWPRLRKWVDANREKLRARAAVLQARAEWERQDRREDLLLPAGFQLERARTLLTDPGDLTTDDIHEFIELSSAREQAERKRDQARIAEIRAGQERTARLQRITRWAFAAVAAVILIAGSIVGILQWDKARQLAARQLELDHAKANILAELSGVKASRGELDSALRLASHGTGIDLKLPSSAVKASPAAAALAAAISQANWRLTLGHNGPVHSAAFSPDGSRIVTAFATVSWYKMASIWDAASGKEIAFLRGHDIDSSVNSAAFSPNGSRIVTASGDKTARIWNAANAMEIAVLRGHESWVHSAAFSPDGSRIVTASSDKTARIWDAASRKEIAVLRGHEGAVTSAAFSPDGSRIVTASGDKTARIWDAASAREIAVLRGHESWVHSAAFSPDGSRIVTASTDKTARIWDAASGKEIAALRGHEVSVTFAAFSPDGSRIVTASGDSTARIWGAASAKEIAVLRGHDSTVNSAAFSPDGSRVVTASDDNTARIWGAASAMEIVVLPGHDNPVNSAAFSPDGSRIVTASRDKTARIWEAASANEIAVLRGHESAVTSAAFSPDGSRIVTASDDKTARIWHAGSAKEIAVLRGHEGAVTSAAFSPDGSHIVTASDANLMTPSYENTARIWDAASAKEIAVLRGHGDDVNSAAFSPDGSRIVTASSDKIARIWDAASAKEIAVLRGHEGRVTSATFSPDGSRILTASSDKTARIWDAASAEEIAVLRGHEDRVNSAGFSPDESRIVTTSYDKTARIWDAASAKEIAVLRGHEGAVTSAAFSPDGSRIVTASWDKTARIWDARLFVLSPNDLLVEACRRLAGLIFLTKLTREEMRLAGYPESTPEIDVCKK